MDVFWKISDLAKYVGRHVNTVDGWFKELEDKKIHYVNREENRREKVYNQLDLDIALFIKEKRQKKWALDSIFTELLENFELRSFPLEMESTNTPQISDVELLKDSLKAELMEQMKEHYEQIDKRLEARDRLLMESLKETLELKKQIAASQEEILNNQKREGFWSIFFRKN